MGSEMCIRDSFKGVMDLYNQQTIHEGKPKSYEKLMTMLKTHIAEKRRAKIRADHDQKARAALTQELKALATPKSSGKTKASKGDCRQWMSKGTCHKGKDCPFDHDDDKRGSRKGRSKTPKGRGRSKGRNRKGNGTPRNGSKNSQNSSGSSKSGKSKGKGAKKRGKSPSGKEDRAPCRFYLQGKCDKGKNCDYWHTPKCIHYQKGNCREGKKCIYLHVDGKNQSSATPAVEDENKKKTQEQKPKAQAKAKGTNAATLAVALVSSLMICLLYTSDAADE